MTDSGKIIENEESADISTQNPVVSTSAVSGFQSPNDNRADLTVSDENDEEKDNEKKEDEIEEDVDRDDEKVITQKPMGLFTWIINFSKPVLDHLAPGCQEVEITFNIIKEGCEKLDIQYGTDVIWNLSWEGIKSKVEYGTSAFFTKIRSPEQRLVETSFAAWNTFYGYLRESLPNLLKLHEYISPPITGLEPMYEIDGETFQTQSITSLCWMLNLNLMQRMFVHFQDFLQGALEYRRHLVESIQCHSSQGV